MTKGWARKKQDCHCQDCRRRFSRISGLYQLLTVHIPACRWRHRGQSRRDFQYTPLWSLWVMSPQTAQTSTNYTALNQHCIFGPWTSASARTASWRALCQNPAEEAMALAKITMLQRTLVGAVDKCKGRVTSFDLWFFVAGNCKPKDVLLRHVREELQRGMPKTFLPWSTRTFTVGAKRNEVTGKVSVAPNIWREALCAAVQAMLAMHLQGVKDSPVVDHIQSDVAPGEGLQLQVDVIRSTLRQCSVLEVLPWIRQA